LNDSFFFERKLLNDSLFTIIVSIFGWLQPQMKTSCQYAHKITHYLIMDEKNIFLSL